MLDQLAEAWSLCLEGQRPLPGSAEDRARTLCVR